MADLKLFHLAKDGPKEIAGHSVAVEKSLQGLFETNLEALLGVRFLATKYTTGQVHRGRIDTLGTDENGCPAITEHRTLNKEDRDACRS